MSEVERSRIARNLTPRTNRFIPTGFVNPETGVRNVKQQLFCLLDDTLEILYGGAAGGGKSEGVLRAAAQYLDVPGYSAMIFRRTYRDLALPGALMHRSHQWWDGNKEAAWAGEGKVWRFSTGASLQFGYMEHDGDEKRYQSAEFQFIGFDELTQFSQEQYTYMFSRLRRLLGSNIPIRMRGASNPGGRGHLWVKKRFKLPEGVHDNPNRKFIPAFLEDNPFLDQSVYEMSLSELSAVTFRQLRRGDWDAESVGGFFEPDELMVIDRSELPHRSHLLSTVRHWDLAATKPTDDNPDPDWTAGVKMSKWKRLSDPMVEKFAAMGVELPAPPYWIVEHVARDRRDPGGVEELVRAAATLDGKGVVQSFEQERGASGKTVVAHYRSNVLDGHRVMKLIPSGDKATRAKPVAARAREGKVFVLAGDWNENFLDELRVFGLKDVHDDQVDGLSGGYEQLRVIEAMSTDDQVGEY